MKDGLQLTDPLPQLLVFGAKGLQFVGELPLLLPDEREFLQLTVGLQALGAFLLGRNKIKRANGKPNENKEKIYDLFLYFSPQVEAFKYLSVLQLEASRFL